MKKFTNIEQKLVKYSAAAGSVLVASSMSNAQIIYTDVNPDIMHYGGTGIEHLDINNDGTTDFMLAAIDTTIQNSAGTFNVRTTLCVPYGTAGNEIAGSMPGNYNYALALTSGYMIDASLTFIGATNTMAYNINSANPYNEHWNGVTDRYLGLRFHANGSTYYGWARLDVDASGATFVLKDYAYNSALGQGIAAGDMGNATAIDKSSDSNVRMYSSANTLTIETDIPNTDGHLQVVNLSGQIVNDQTIDAGKEVVNLEGLSAGIYTAVVQFGSETARHRIIIR